MLSHLFLVHQSQVGQKAASDSPQAGDGRGNLAFDCFEGKTREGFAVCLPTISSYKMSAFMKQGVKDCKRAAG